MPIKYKDVVKALSEIETERKIPESVVIDALKEAMCKAFKKNSELSDIEVEAMVDEKKGTIDIYQLYRVVETVEDDELEISLEDAKALKPDAAYDDMISRKVDFDIDSMSRAAAQIARNVIKQKIREGEKIAVYNEYIGQLDEMVLGIVESVKEKFTLVNLGKTVAMMRMSDQIPGERLVEGQKLRVIITNVNKDGKGSQVLVSRADKMLVKRLFEKEVPEIFQGIVEIKAIARDAGERTKMAVISHNDEIDPIGACIGQRGARVQEIIDELHGEKIDIFLWSEDITQLVRNALAPAEIEAVLPGEEENSLLVVVAEDQLSLAIGRKGKNARLAVKLCDCKIDIKTRSEIDEMGLDYDELLAKAEEHRKEIEAKIKEREMERLKQETIAAEEKRQQAVEELRKKSRLDEMEDSDEVIPEEMRDMIKEDIRAEMAMKQEDSEEKVEETEVEVPVVEEVEEEVETTEEVVEEPVVEEKAPETKTKRTKADLEAIAQKNEYVSSLESLADTSKPKQEKATKKKKRKSEDDDIKVRNKVLEQQLRKDIDSENFKPVYTEEELEEIERQQMEEEESQYDIDYDEYEDYYDDEDNN